MKRILSLLLCLVMLLSLVPAAAAEDIELIPIVEEPGDEEIVIVGEEDEPADWEEPLAGNESYGFTGLYIEPLYRSVITEEQLAEQLRSAAASADLLSVDNSVKYCSTMSAAGIYLRAQMVKRSASVTFLIPEDLHGNTADTGREIYERAVIHSENRTPQEGDSLRWGNIGCGYNISSVHDDEYGDCCQLTYIFSWTTTAAQESTLTARVNSAISSLNLGGKTEKQKIRAIHDYICDNVDYDYEHLPEGADYPLQFSAYAAMVNGTAVCQGYAILFYRMAKEAGFDVRVVTSAEHAWNIVRIGSVYYNIDTTWDGETGETTHDWYLLGMRDFTHYHHIREYPFYTDEFNASYPMAKDSRMDKANLYKSFRTTAKDTVTTYASSKPKVLIFGAAVADSFTDEFMKAFLNYRLTDINVVFVDTTKEGRYDVKQYRNSVGGGEVRFCYDMEDGAADACFEYLRSFGYTLRTVQLPLIVFVDTNNKVQNFRVGAQGAATVAGLVKDCLGVTLSYGAPRITQQPFDQKLSSGTAKFSTQGLGFGALRYQWYYRTSANGTWTKCSGTGSGTPTYKVSAAARRNGYQYRCAVKNAYGTTYTKTVTLYVQAPPAITQQPVDVKGKVGSTVTFSVKAAGDELRYQWYFCKPNDISWNACSGESAATATLSVEVKDYRDGYKYKCNISNDVGTAWSQSATLTLAGPTITTQPGDVKTAAGSTAQFTVVSKDADSYRWYYRSSSSGSWKACSGSGYNTATYSVTATTARDGYQYRCKLTNADGANYTRAATLTVMDLPTITVQPVSATGYYDESVQFIVEADNAYSYEWYCRACGTSSWSTAYCNRSTLSVPAIEDNEGFQFYCKVSNPAGSVDSDIVTLNVHLYKVPKIEIQPYSATANAGNNATFAIRASGGDLSFQWQYRASSTDSWKNCSGCTEATLIVEAKAYRDGYQYRCKVTNTCGSKTSVAATLTVLPSITQQPTDQTAAQGETVSFSVKAAGAESYQWFFCSSAGGEWKKCSGGTGATLTVEAKSYRNGYQYYCEVSNANGSLSSEIATLTVLSTAKSVITQQLAD